MTILVFISRANSQPTPTSEPVRVKSCLDCLSREASHCYHIASAILIPLHLLVNIVSNNTSGFHTHPYYIPELLFLGSLTPICLSLATYQNIGVELMATFIQAVDLHAFCEDSPVQLKISIMTQTRLSCFVLGDPP
jgi:hypothetical protein